MNYPIEVSELILLVGSAPQKFRTFIEDILSFVPFDVVCEISCNLWIKVDFPLFQEIIYEREYRMS